MALEGRKRCQCIQRRMLCLGNLVKRFTRSYESRVERISGHKGCRECRRGGFEKVMAIIPELYGQVVGMVDIVVISILAFVKVRCDCAVCRPTIGDCFANVVTNYP